MTAARSEVAAERGLRPIRIGISACLLGKRVRFDGGHKRDVFLTEGFGRFVEWVPVCPEVEAGFGIPREPMRLVRIEPGMRLLTVKTGIDLTERLQRFSRMRASALAREDLSGYLLKKDSPSCGLERVRVYERHGSPTRGGRGLFAAALVEAFPHLPVEEEGRLAGGMSRQDLQRRYVDGFMQALAQLATAQRHTNVLQHMAGYFKNRLNAMSKRELAETITDYRRGLVPLVVPLTLVRHHVRTLEVTYLAGQTYLEPHPKELMLRNHV
jgi:uncharacterized protein YbbK (DUF523 family)